MELTFEKLRLALFCWTLLIGVAYNADPTDEPTEILGNYTITIRVSEDGEDTKNSAFQFRLFGEADGVRSYPEKALCKDDAIPYSDVADIGRLCSIKLKLSEKNPCTIKEFVIVDNVRQEEAIFNVAEQLKNEEQTFPRSGSIKLKWNKWEPRDTCNCTSKTLVKIRTCQVTSKECQSVSACEGPDTKTESCECKDETGNEENSPTAIVVIACTVGVLVILVVSAICYSRRLNKRKAEEEVRKSNINYPIIVVSPPEETESETSKALLSGGIQHIEVSPNQCSLVTPEESPDDDVGKPSYPIEWEENDLYVSSDKC